MIKPRAKKIPAWKVPTEYRRWVYDQGSLTKRLIDASNNHFSVRVTFQGRVVPTLDERSNLNVKPRRMALVREVELLCYGEVWVRARSIIPFSTLSGKERQLQYLGNKPLGAFLFKSKAMTRSKLEFVVVPINQNRKIFGRRSVFYLSGKPLLVSELFMPTVFGVKE